MKFKHSTSNYLHQILKIQYQLTTKIHEHSQYININDSQTIIKNPTLLVAYASTPNLV